MFANAVSALQVLFAFVGTLVATPEPGALALVIAVTGVVLAAVMTSRATPPSVSARRAHPWRAIDVSTLLAQSDPDAAGHPRARAPGGSRPAA